MFGVNDLEGDEVVVKSEVVAKKKDDEVNVVEEVVSTASDAAPVSAATITIVELTLAQTLAELKSARPKTKGILLQEPNKRRKFLTAKRAEEKRNRPPTKAQRRSIIRAREAFLKSKRRSETETLKDKVLEEDKESEELKQCLEIVLDDGYDVTIDATPLSTKSPSIVDYKIYQEGKKSFFQIIRAYVKARFKKTKPVNYMDNFLLLNLKTMFEHHVEDIVWKNQQGLVKLLNWKLFDSCGVHCVIVQPIPYYLLVEKMYPLTNHTLHQMFNNVKLQVDYECEMAFELLRLINIKFRGGLLGFKRLHNVLEVTAASVRITAAKQKLEEEKTRRHGKVYNWETATYGKIWDNEDVYDLGSVETEFTATVFKDTLTSEATLSCEPTVSSLNDEIDFRISYDESDDEDCTPAVSCFDDLDFFNDLENEFPAIDYNDAQTSKLDDLDYL
ncbi:hypothetical protein Tco_0880040 [Tanacetum coccineum]